MQIVTRRGPEVAPHIDDLARLRIEVFRAFPYLYEGSPDYERTYLATYASSPESLFVLAFDGETVVGASAVVAIDGETERFRRPCMEAGWEHARSCDFGESVLLASYRERGIGVRFFQEREAYARRLGRFDHCCFGAVERPADHPLRPVD